VRRGWRREPCPKDDLPQQVAGRGDTNQHHDPVPEVPSILVALNLEIAVVQNLLQNVEGLGFVGKVDTRIIQWNESTGSA